MSETRPRVQRVYEDLLENIIGGVYLPGAMIPAGKVIAQDKGVSYSTAIAAVNLLRDQGLVGQGVRGKGTYVSDCHTIERFSQAHPRGWLPRDEAGEPIARVLGVEVIDSAGLLEQRLLEVGEDTRIVVRRRIFQHSDGSPWFALTSYFPLEVARDTPLADPDSFGIPPWVVFEQAGIKMSHFSEGIRTRPATALERADLRLGSDEWVLEAVRRTYAEGGQVVEALTFITGGQTELVFDDMPVRTG